MVEKEVTVWGIHAGETGDADSLFLSHNVVALGWHQMGDLGLIQPDRDHFKSKIASCFPTMKPGAIPVNAGQLFRFVHRMSVGDYVAYPSKIDKRIHIGRVEGNYEHDVSEEPSYSA